jgi:hypothetical protein
MSILDGNEVEGKIGEIGGYSVDVSANGDVKLNASVSKDFGYSVKASSIETVELNIFVLAEEIAKKNGIVWLETGAEALKKLVGII